jgi:hypothetical protein
MKPIHQSTHFMILALLFIVGFSLSKFSSAQVQTAGITTGVASGKYYSMAGEIVKYCNAAVPMTVYESAGSVSNVERVLSDKKYQYGITQFDALVYKALSDPKVKDKIKVILPMYDNEIHLVASEASGIRGINDLRGKRVIVGPEGSGNYVTAQIIKSKTGIDWIDIPVAPDSNISQLLLGQADAMIYTQGKPAAPLTKLGAAAKGKIRLVPMSHPALEGFYTKALFADNTYPWQPQAVSSYAVKNVLVTFDFRNQYQAEIGALTACIVNNLPALEKNGDQKWRDVDPADYKTVNWPIHPVAKRYLDKAIGK